MEGIDAAVLALAGYASVPVAAFAMRKQWPDQVRFLLAGLLALGVAIAMVLLRGDALTTQAVLASFGVSFAAQQTTFHVEIPGAGSPVVVEKLEGIV